jgi:cyclic pyranopterin phosphate synthase
MRDVHRKPSTLRKATASSSVRMDAATVALVRAGSGPKGDALAAARIAGVLAAKDVSRLIPYCHPVRVDHVAVDFEVREGEVGITCSVTAVDRTGVEMEALGGATVAALTLYDMLKPVDEHLVIGETRLAQKSGGKSDFKERFARPLRAAVIVVSDSTAAGAREDRSGRAIAERLREAEVEVSESLVVPDDVQRVEAEVRRLVAAGIDIVATTGGTGLGPRDVTIEAVARVIERSVPGIAEAMRAHGIQRTPRAALSRSLAGVAGRTLILTLPGSSRGAQESLDAIWPGVLHIFPMIWGGGHPPA